MSATSARGAASLLLLALAPGVPLAASQSLDVGLSGRGTLISATEVPGGPAATATVLLIGGLSGNDGSVAAVRHAVRDLERTPRRRRAFGVLAIALANPDTAPLEFPPTGIAYRDHPESHALWRWIGVHAPDRVLIIGKDASGLAAALTADQVAEVGAVPARDVPDLQVLRALSPGDLPTSPAHREIERRRARSALELSEELARFYGRDFRQPIYVDALALIGQLRLGHLSEVRALAEPYVNGTLDSLAHPNSLVFAGHLVFGELARRTHDPRYLARVRAAAAFGFESDGQPREAMPFNGGFSDALFMGTAILAQAGALTGERRYFDMAVRHVDYMQKLVLRPDGLYRHHPGTEVAWGRGNGFPALGFALTLSDFPRDHPAYPHLLAAYRHLMAQLLRYQDRDGMWRNVIDVPGAYPEYSATAMIGFAMQRGLARGWLPVRPYREAVQRAWMGLLTRTATDGHLVDVCESTARASTLDDYMHRAAILGPDPRGGAMALLFATEMAGLK